MSIFSDTQGTPERVYALMRLIEAVGDPVSRKVAADLLDPKFSLGRSVDHERSDFTQTFRAAVSLGLVEEVDGVLTNAGNLVPPTYLQFGDLVHARLVAAPLDDPNSVALDAFALFADRLEVDGDGQWLATASNETLADQIRNFLATKRPEAGTFNPTRVAPLTKWTDAIGLTAEVTTKQRPILDVSRRLARELYALPDASAGLPSSVFVTCVLDRMPYLPGGNRYTSLFGDVRTAGTGRISIVLSAALRDLHDEGVIQLDVTGDASGSARLAEDRFHALEAFNVVRVPAAEATA